MFEGMISALGVLIVGLLIGVAATVGAIYVMFRGLVAMSDVRLTPAVPREPHHHPLLTEALEDRAQRGQPADASAGNSDPSTEFQPESYVALNFLVDFLFREFRDTVAARQYITKLFDKEFKLMKRNTSVGRIIERITVRDLSLGTSIPILEKIWLKRSKNGKVGRGELDMTIKFSYQGHFHLKLDADLVLGKHALISVTILKLEGRVHFALRHSPDPHYWISFIEEPALLFEVESLIEGHSFQQLNTLITNQIKRSIKRKHTLPAFKIRYAPFFKMPKDTMPVKPKINGTPLQQGHLFVKVKEALDLQRIRSVTKGAYVFCSLSLQNKENFDPTYQHTVRNRSRETTFYIEIPKAGPGGSIGVFFAATAKGKEEVCRVQGVDPGSPASSAGLLSGDVVLAIDGTPVISAQRAIRLIKDSREKNVVFNVLRYEIVEDQFELGETIPDDAQVTSRVSLSEKPSWDQTLTFLVGPEDENLYIRLYECRPDVSKAKSSKNFLIGFAVVPLAESALASASLAQAVTRKCQLRTSSSPGAPVAGEIELEIRHAFGDTTPIPKASTKTSTKRVEDDSVSQFSSYASAAAIDEVEDNRELFADSPLLERRRLLADMVPEIQRQVDLEEETRGDLDRQMEEAVLANDTESIQHLAANIAASEERAEVLVKRFMRAANTLQLCEIDLAQAGLL